MSFKIVYFNDVVRMSRRNVCPFNSIGWIDMCRWAAWMSVLCMFVYWYSSSQLASGYLLFVGPVQDHNRMHISYHSNGHQIHIIFFLFLSKNYGFERNSIGSRVKSIHLHIKRTLNTAKCIRLALNYEPMDRQTGRML